MSKTASLTPFSYNIASKYLMRGPLGKKKRSYDIIAFRYPNTKSSMGFYLLNPRRVVVRECMVPSNF